mmetsp:Transcript_9253/g.37943  ORF Transcript_9253/g.37943 Transcript_9253/m.37943 type:complete len:226 (-) Transcript_9253:116-793(-)
MATIHLSPSQNVAGRANVSSQGEGARCGQDPSAAAAAKDERRPWGRRTQVAYLCGVYFAGARAARPDRETTTAVSATGSGGGASFVVVFFFFVAGFLVVAALMIGASSSSVSSGDGAASFLRFVPPALRAAVVAAASVGAAPFAAGTSPTSLGGGSSPRATRSSAADAVNARELLRPWTRYPAEKVSMMTGAACSMAIVPFRTRSRSTSDTNVIFGRVRAADTAP